MIAKASGWSSRNDLILVDQDCDVDLGSVFHFFLALEDGWGITGLQILISLQIFFCEI